MLNDNPMDDEDCIRVIRGLLNAYINLKDAEVMYEHEGDEPFEGMTLMNEIVNKHPQIDPDELLNELRSQIMETLHQKGDPGAAKDGMDMLVCKYNRQDSRLLFAGANNPLYLVREGELTEFKTDKMPVSIHEVMNPFNVQEIKLKPGDLIYLFSDGYADQFGGPLNKKFKYGPMKELIMQISDRSMEDQKKELEQTIISWKGDEFQVDDILFFGIKFV